MFTVIKWGRGLLAALLLAVFTATATADARSSGHTPSSVPTRSLPTGPAAEHTPSGNPELGVMIIVGALALLIFVGWLFTRVGDDRHRGGDKTLLG